MHALEELYRRLSASVTFMHRARWKALWSTVLGLIRGEELWLTALGRARPGKAARKHSIKAVDRLLGNPLLYAERKQVYAAIAAQLLGKRPCPVVLVDTMEIRPRAYALTAALAYEGRTFPIYSLVTTKGKVTGPTCARFLRDLANILPSDSRPILITDAGFESPWFRAVEAIGWDFVGRVRNRTRFLMNGRWVSNEDIFSKATRKPRNLGRVPFPKTAPRARRLVLSAKPISGHRKRFTSRGTPRRRWEDLVRGRTANQPWLLATTLMCRPSQVVVLYALRMHIEQTFRDTKNHRWGWSLRHCRSRSHCRLELLLLIAAIALFVTQSIGYAAEQLGLHYGHQANTIRHRRVLSHFVIGGLMLRSAEISLVSLSALHKALRSLQRKIRYLGRHAP
jgi:hypothetical protein